MPGSVNRSVFLYVCIRLANSNANRCESSPNTYGKEHHPSTHTHTHTGQTISIDDRRHCRDSGGLCRIRIGVGVCLWIRVRERFQRRRFIRIPRRTTPDPFDSVSSYFFHTFSTIDAMGRVAHRFMKRSFFHIARVFYSNTPSLSNFFFFFLVRPNESRTVFLAAETLRMHN